MRRLSLFLILICLLVPALVAQAQAPDAINTALNDLSQRVGHTVTFADLDNWSFEQKVYPSPALGCPQPGVAYAAVQTVGLQFILTYNGTAYDYRISGDKSIVILCTSNTATEVPSPCPPPGDAAYLVPRLGIGVQARVEEGGVPNNIRDLPGTSGKYLGEIPPAQTFTVLDGPRCSLIDKIIWWQVNYNGIVGWTAEGKDGDYWIEPLNLIGTPPAIPFKTPITPANAAQISLVPQGQIVGPVAVSADGDKIAQPITNTIQIISVGSSQPPVTFSDPSITGTATALAFDASGKWLLAGYSDGRVLLIDVSSNTAATFRRAMTSHTGAVNAVAFSADGKLVVSGGVDMVVQVDDASNGASVAKLQAHRAPVTSVRFSADGATIISKDEQGITYLWRVGAASAG